MTTSWSRARAQRARRAARGSTRAATRRRRLRRVLVPQRRDRAGQPVLEGQLGLDPVRRRHARRGADRDLRDPGLRLRRAAPLRPPRARGLGRRRPRRAPGPAGGRAARKLSPRLLDPRARSPRARTRRRKAPGRQPLLEHRPPALVGLLDEAEAAATAERLLGEELYSGWGVRTLGARRGGLQPTRLPHRDGLAPRELTDRRRPGPLRLPRGGRHDRLRDARRRAPLRASAAGDVRRLSAAR